VYWHISRKGYLLFGCAKYWLEIIMVENQTKNVIITDVTLREYGQNVPSTHLNIFTPEIRLEIALKLIDAGFSNIEILSCIHPKLAPAMNEKALKKIAAGLGRVDGVNLITLVPNRSGYRNFLDMNLGQNGYNHTIGIFFSAFEDHNLANLGRSIKETIDEYKKIAIDVAAKNIRLVAYVSAAFGYFDTKNGALIKADMEDVNSYIDLLLDLGAQTVTLSDLQGVADQEETGRVLEAILNRKKGKDINKLGYHPHNISGESAITNSKIAYDMGIRRFDASLGGTGGCVTGAPGNQPTEMLVRFFHESGIKTGLDEKKIFFLKDMIDKELFRKIPLPQKG
jgi:hydroxymethylglutaryl-CoA lyase